MTELPPRPVAFPLYGHGNPTITYVIHAAEHATYVTVLEEQVREAAAALRGLHDDVDEYRRINNLGGHDNHWLVCARKVLKEICT